ncbi:MAG: hypothetical protein GEV13_00455 [Rhodospirillales bacterium]|nr:hypothetical protein [Rhodospirillales bacterium]
MHREAVTIGVIVLTRCQVERFTDKHIEILKIFADQAVIAIQNVRLFTEIQKKSRQLEIARDEVQALNKDLEAKVAAQVGELERVGRLRRFLAPQLPGHRLSGR